MFGGIYFGAAPPASAGGVSFTYSIALNTGAYTLTGSVASILAGRSISVTAGSYALSGTATNLTRTYVLVSVAGSYTYTGVANVLRRIEGGSVVTATAHTYENIDATAETSLTITATTPRPQVVNVLASAVTSASITATLENFSIKASLNG